MDEPPLRTIYMNTIDFLTRKINLPPHLVLWVIFLLFVAPWQRFRIK
jgi:hypothetical protein